MADIFSALREDHEKQRTLIDLLCKTKGESDGRKELFERVKQALKAHSRAEERCFYVPLLEIDKTQEKARHSVAEHHEFDEMMEELDETNMSSPHWLAVANHLNERLLHHLDEEEREVFPLAGKVLHENKKSELAREYQKIMEEGKNIFEIT